MRKVIFSTIAAAAAFTSTAAFAEDTAEVTVNATLTRACTITSPNETINLVGTTPVNGNFSYSCNFTGSPSVAITSLNKGVLGGEGGANLVDYSIYLNDTDGLAPQADWLRASQANGTPTFDTITTTTGPNVEQSPVFKLALVEDLAVAGDYTDTLQITVTP